MGKVRVQKLILDGYGRYLGMEKGYFIIKHEDRGIEKYPLFEREIGEVVLQTGNMVSTGALACMGFWGIDCLIMTKKGRPVAMLKALDDDSHVKTRLAQYRAFENEKAFQIAKAFILGKTERQDRVLEKYSLETHGSWVEESLARVRISDLKTARRRLMAIESKCSRKYFQQIFLLFPKKLRPAARRTFKAHDGVNNIFNLAYEMLNWKVHRALIKAKLEPYLGFLHSMQFGKPSLVCDFMELYRYLIDDFIIQQCTRFRKGDFTFKSERLTRKTAGKRQYLNNVKTRAFMKELNQYFEMTVKVPRIRVGRRQTIETLINEEAMLFARFLREEIRSWNPRIAVSS